MADGLELKGRLLAEVHASVVQGDPGRQYQDFLDRAGQVEAEWRAEFGCPEVCAHNACRSRDMCGYFHHTVQGRGNMRSHIVAHISHIFAFLARNRIFHIFSRIFRIFWVIFQRKFLHSPSHDQEILRFF